MADERVLSLMLNAELDSLGFNKESVKRRVEMFKKRSKAKAAASKQILGCDYKEKIIVGSRRDGIATETSDTDVLLINHVIHCSSDAEEFRKEDKKVCLLLENEDAPPGYAFLSLYKCNSSNRKYFTEIESATEFRKGKTYFSSKKYMDILEEQQMSSRRGWFGRVVNIGMRKGPSIPKTIDALSFEADLVGAFTASCKHITDKWLAKERLHDWPTEEVVDTAAKLPLYVVAVGEHGCQDENLLWRISFNKLEKALVQSMNDSQTKVLVMIRLLAKNVLTPVCPDITSYVIKNVVFHVSEQHPLQDFNKEKLVHRLHDCLKYLRYCIENKVLPNYIDAEKNLFQGKLTDETMVTDAIRAIHDIIKNGREVFLFYLTNKMRPGNISSRYPGLLPIRESLLKGYLEDMFAQKKVNSMTMDQLINLHVHADSCSSELKLFILEIYYVYIPFYFNYGFKALKSDLNKMRPQNKRKNNILHVQGEQVASEDFNDIDETELFNKEEFEAQVTEDIEQQEAEVPIPSMHLDANATDESVLHGEIWECVKTLPFNMLLRCIIVIKYMMLNLFEVIHLLCVVFLLISMRNNVRDDTVWFVDIIGLSWIAVIGVSVIQKKIATMFNLVYVTLLILFWRMMMSYSDPYTLYFQELYVMLDPRQQGRQDFRTTDLDMNDMQYFNKKQTMYA